MALSTSWSVILIQQFLLILQVHTILTVEATRVAQFSFNPGLPIPTWFIFLILTTIRFHTLFQIMHLPPSLINPESHSLLFQLKVLSFELITNISYTFSMIALHLIVIKMQHNHHLNPACLHQFDFTFNVLKSLKYYWNIKRAGL